MGTNYYFYPKTDDACEHCGRSGSQPIHIGLSSVGWAFGLHIFERSQDGPRNLEEWYALIEKGGMIRNEYGDIITLQYLKCIIEDRPPNCRRHPLNQGQGKGTWDLIVGEFS